MASSSSTSSSYRSNRRIRRSGRGMRIRPVITTNTRRRYRAPKTIAAENFSKTLRNLHIEKSVRDSWKAEVSTMEKARVMNMDVLARVYMFMVRNGIADWNTFSYAYNRGVFREDNIRNDIDPILSSPKVVSRREGDISEDEKESILIQFMALFIRYIWVILNHRATSAHEIEQARASIRAKEEREQEE